MSVATSEDVFDEALARIEQGYSKLSTHKLTKNISSEKLMQKKKRRKSEVHIIDV